MDEMMDQLSDQGHYGTINSGASQLANKRKKLSVDERLMKNRERNKSHARKTRERKKNHMIAFKARIKQLESENENLRNRVDARYTASVLLGLAVKPAGSSSSSSSSSSISSSTNTDVSSNSGLAGLGGEDMELPQAAPAGLEIKASKDLCGSPYSPGEAFTQALADNQISESTRRVRRRGKYTPQERESIRRERNRIHAKKTRDKKKIFLEASEKAIHRLERDVQVLREYLVAFNMISTQELSMLIERDKIAHQELSALKDPSSGNRIHSSTLVEEANVLGLNGSASTGRYRSNSNLLDTPSLGRTLSPHHGNNGIQSLLHSSGGNRLESPFTYYNSSASSASSGVSDREDFDDEFDDENGEEDDPEISNHSNSYNNEGDTRRTRLRNRSRSRSENPLVDNILKREAIDTLSTRRDVSTVSNTFEMIDVEESKPSLQHMHNSSTNTSEDNSYSTGHTSGTLSSHASSTSLDAMSSLSMLSQAVINNYGMNTSNLSKNDNLMMVNVHRGNADSHTATTTQATATPMMNERSPMDITGVKRHKSASDLPTLRHQQQQQQRHQQGKKEHTEVTPVLMGMGMFSRMSAGLTRSSNDLKSPR